MFSQYKEIYMQKARAFFVPCIHKKNRTGLWFFLGAAVLAGFSASGLDASSNAAFAGAYAAAACDATTGASCKVVGVKTTLSSATLTWTEKHRNGTRNFCYGIGSPSKCAKVTSRARGTKEQVVNGLNANTKYSYKFFGIWKGKTKSVVTGTFTTNSSACGTSVISVVEVGGVVLSVSGDSLENALVTLTRKSDNQAIAVDTTDLSGGYFFEVDPGTYEITVSHPPFTSPAPYTATVIAKKPLDVPDFVLSGAFQIGGTLVSENMLDSLSGATITAVNAAEPSETYTRITDDEGHFTFGMKQGEYMLTATYNGKSMASPLRISVTRSMELPPFSLAYVAAVRGREGRLFGSTNSLKQKQYDAKGVRNPDAPVSRWRRLFGAP